MALLGSVAAAELHAKLQELGLDFGQAALKQHRLLPVVVPRHLFKEDKITWTNKRRFGIPPPPPTRVGALTRFRRVPVYVEKSRDEKQTGKKKKEKKQGRTQIIAL